MLAGGTCWVELAAPEGCAGGVEFWGPGSWGAAGFVTLVASGTITPAVVAGTANEQAGS